jgi:hypothetical protein
MKQSGGDPAAFGRLMDEWKDAIPLEDHPIWEGAKKAAQFEQNAQAVTKTPWRSAVDAVSLPVDVAAMLHVPGAAAARHVLAGAETLNWLMARPGGRNILSRLGKLSPASPKFAGLWSTAKAAAAATPAAQALKPSQPAPYAGGGPVMERLRRDTLRQLRGS